MKTILNTKLIKKEEIGTNFAISYIELTADSNYDGQFATKTIKLMHDCPDKIGTNENGEVTIDDSLIAEFVSQACRYFKESRLTFADKILFV